MRTARYIVPGVVYHLIWRFVDRRWFFSDDVERAEYLRRLGEALEPSDWRCLAYALMSNHIHLAAIAGWEPLGIWSKRVHSPFVRWMNQRHDRLGPLIADRPRDYAVASAKEPRLIAYIHNNPVRAGVVAHACDSTWTSHRAYLGLAASPPWLHVAEGLQRIGVDAAELDGWVEQTPGESGMVDVTALRRELRSRGAIEPATPSANVVPLVCRPYANVRVDPRWVLAFVAELLSITVLELCSRRTATRYVEARAVAVHCGRALGLSQAALAAALGFSSTAISKIVRRPLPAHTRQLAMTCLARFEIELASRSSGPSLAAQ